MATAGSGDVLSGVLAGVLMHVSLSSRKSMPPVQLAALGVFDSRTCRRQGSRSMWKKEAMTARDIIRFLPEILRIKDDMDDGKM